jgi:DNA-binding SARP family transcriptional activator
MDGQVVVIVGDEDGSPAALVRSLAPDAQVFAVGADGDAPSRPEATQDAVRALLEGGQRGAVAALLAHATIAELDAFELGELETILAHVGDDALRADPRCLIQAARLADLHVALDVRSRLLDEAERIADSDAARLEIRAERANDLARDGHLDEADARARAVLNEAAPSAHRARAAALSALGMVGSLRVTPASLLQAETALQEAAAQFRLLGDRLSLASVLRQLAYRVHFTLGDLEQAMRRSVESLELVPERTRLRATALSFAAEIHAHAGQFDRAEAWLAELAEIARPLGDHRLLGYHAWIGARMAAMRCDRVAVIERLAEAERHPSDWFEHLTGIEFLAEAADLLVRVDESELARRYARRAKERADATPYPDIAWLACGMVEAAFGDPDEGERLLAMHASSPAMPPREAWRTHLYRGVAASRAGRPGDASDWARRALESATQLGYPELPMLHDAAAARRLGIGADRAATGTFELQLLGGFELRSGSERLEVPPGLPQLVIKLLAVAGGRLGAEGLIEACWPEVDPVTGRARLRNLLNRLRSTAGELVRRDGPAVTLGAVRVDAAELGEAAERALAAPPAERAERAREALSHWHGTLLPDDHGHELIDNERELLERRCLDLVDDLVDDACARGDLAEAVRLLDRAIEIQPLDEARYLRSAELLLQQGRRGSAHAVARRAADIRDALSLPRSPQLQRLLASTAPLDARRTAAA